MHYDETVVVLRCDFQLSSHKSPGGWDGREGPKSHPQLFGTGSMLADLTWLQEATAKP